MRRFSLLLALTLLATVLGSGTARAALPRAAVRQAAVVAPQLQRELDGAGRGEMVKAIVVLKSQADLASVHGLARKNRPGAAARILRARADLTQRSLRSLLKLRRAQGLVSDIEPLWIVNAIAVTATPAVISEFAAHKDVREIRPDLAVPAPPAPPAAATTASAPAETNVAPVNARALWDLGYRGQGIVVANMDTGVDVTHPDLASRWRGGTNSWYDPNGEHPATPTDVSGHGTWTMGVMGGRRRGRQLRGDRPGRDMDSRQDLQRSGNRHLNRNPPGLPVAARPRRQPGHRGRTRRRQRLVARRQAGGSSPVGKPGTSSGYWRSVALPGTCRSPWQACQPGRGWPSRPTRRDRQAVRYSG